jgi:dynein heavy chain
VCLSRPEYFEDAFSLIRLWVHEVQRVFADRLIDDRDALQFTTWVRDTTKARFNVDLDKLFVNQPVEDAPAAPVAAPTTPSASSTLLLSTSHSAAAAAAAGAANDAKTQNLLSALTKIRNLAFGDYVERKSAAGGSAVTAAAANAMTSAASRPYQEIPDSRKLSGVWQQYLDDYNYLTDKPMKLVLFRFAIEHASRIARILKHPGGHGTSVL